MHAGEDDDFGVDLHRLARQRQAVADDVGDAVEDLRRLVVVGEDDGVARALQLEDGVDVAGEDWPLDRRDGVFSALIEGRGAGEGGGGGGWRGQWGPPYTHTRQL